MTLTGEAVVPPNAVVGEAAVAAVPVGEGTLPGSVTIIQDPSVIAVKDQVGANFDEQFANALALAAAQRLPIRLPGGTVESNTTFSTRKPTIVGDPSFGDLYSRIRIYGNNTTILWTGAEDSAMWDLSGAWWWNVDSIVFDANDVTGVIPIYMGGAEDRSTRTLRHNKLARLMLHNCWHGLWAGSPLGIDVRGLTLEQCEADGCSGSGFVFQGPNPTSILLLNCAAYNYARYGVECLQADSDWRFENDEITDPWGNALAWDQYDSSAWTQRIVEHGDGTHGVPGGAPKIDIHVFDAVNVSDIGQTYAFGCDQAKLQARGLRAEGNNNGVYHSTGTHAATREGTRFVTVLEDCHDGGGDSIEAGIYSIRIETGLPIEIRGGSYSGLVEATPGPGSSDTDYKKWLFQHRNTFFKLYADDLGALPDPQNFTRT